MSDSSLIERLAELPSLASVPRAQLEWLAAHGEVKRFDAGTVIYSNASPPPGCYFVLKGQITLRVVRDGMARTVSEFRAGEMSGRLPYSRMPAKPGGTPRAMGDFASVAEEPTEILLIVGSDVREMVRECYDLTALCVHQMIDRTRLFKSDDLQREKMASLGRLAAGLTHELNNPSAAAARSAKLMDACRRDVVAATRALCAAGFTSDQLTAIEALEAKAVADPVARSPLEAADRQDEILDWFEARDIDPGLADALASTPVTDADLDAVAAALSADTLPTALKYVAANATARQLTREIDHATRRIDVLVSTVKRHTQMDRAPVVDAIDVASTLTDTLALIESKARARTLTLALHVESELPTIPGVAGQLNDVWMHLVENAIDFTPAGGCVTVSARPGDDALVVCVTDDGPGIPQEHLTRVFEPFFTTRPVGQGAGLGLDVVQRVVRSHGGHVELSSRPGHTEFRVTLPLKPPA